MRLVCIRGPLKGLNYAIPQGRSSVGRDASCDVTLDDPKVSRVHSYLSQQGDVLSVMDNRSTNGTFVNGSRLAPMTPMRLGAKDTLVIGSCEYAFSEVADAVPIQFTEASPMVTNVIEGDAVAKKFDSVFEMIRKSESQANQTIGFKPSAEQLRNAKLMRSLETLFQMSRRIANVMPLEQLFEEMKKMLFEAFKDAENLVFLIWDEEQQEYVARMIANSISADQAPVRIPHSVFHRALQERVTLLANDALSDERFSASESIIGLSIKSLMCAPLVLGKKTLGVIYLDNRQQTGSYDVNDAELLTAFATQAATAIENARLCEELEKSYLQTLQALVATIEAKDEYTSGHSQRVAQYAVGIATELGWNKDKLDLIKKAGELHDIGKIGIKEVIINKSGRLSDDEFNEIKSHVIKGEAIVRPIKHLEAILPAVRNHHEKLDGTGYPDGLAGDEISIEARILAVADSFDAMTSQRAYNKPLTFEEGLERVKKASGTHFDPNVVVAFDRYISKRIREKTSTVEALKTNSGEEILSLNSDPTPPLPKPAGTTLGNSDASTGTGE